MKETRKKTTEEINEEVVDLKGELFMLRLQKSARNEFKSSEFGRTYAQKVHREAKQKQTNNVGSPLPTISRLIDGYSKLLRMENAVFLLDEMIKKDISPSVVTYSAIINGYRKLGEWDQAYEIYEKMLKQGISPDALTYLSLGGSCSAA
ncbi:pentatricopeptide repeat-containing protein [Canna indica]|uniref:Pentatricopeptide repeat-containing protein n=1 Tax=Canna indica TaxID=4628 RepID=A0AAQ3KF37_9LILI|nr:pentatricopeptide repeat-containing protein [Canna indica]